MAGKKGMKHKKTRKMSDETKRKISETVKKRWQEKEYRDKVSKAHSHPLPDEWKNNISKGMVGMKKSEETKQKMSEYQSNRTVEHEENMREAWKEQWNSLSKQQQLKRINKWLKSGQESDKSYNKISCLEQKVKEQLDDLGIRYIQQKKIRNGNIKYFLDFYIPSKNLVIECNGEYWHSKPKRIRRDIELKQFVENSGKKIIFLWGEEIMDKWFWIGDYLN